jgi:hypothetical protein
MNIDPAVEALAELASTSVREPSPARLAQGLEAVSARLGRARKRRRLVLGSALFAAAAACALLVLARVGLLSLGDAAGQGAHLAYSVEGGSVVEGGYLRESGDRDMKLIFTGGTRLILPRGTRGRLRAVDDTGARIAIEHGTASFEVAPNPHRQWLVEAGPFLVTVKGTAFTVSWDAAKERFELRLTRGRVTVSGPMSGGDITLEAGHRLAVDLPRAETLITALKSPAATDEPLPPETATTTVGAPSPPPVLGPAPRKREPERGWATALSAGRLDDVLRDVERAGLKVSLANASEDDLFALADAARYRRRVSWAREALLTARRRFSTSSRAVDTAYLLGRVEETSDQRLPEALRWYEAYLASAPNGTYAAEALGRRMILVGKWAGSAAAKPIAEEYLQRFPNGTYAGSARALRSVP